MMKKGYVMPARFLFAFVVALVVATCGRLQDSPLGPEIRQPLALSGHDNKILFERAADIFVMNADGSGQINLTNSTRNELHPVWSPDGTKIAFDSNRQVYVMNVDGSGETRLTSSLNGQND